VFDSFDGKNRMVVHDNNLIPLYFNIIVRQVVTEFKANCNIIFSKNISIMIKLIEIKHKNILHRIFILEYKIETYKNILI